MTPPYADRHGDLLTLGGYDTEEEDAIAASTEDDGEADS